MKILWISLLLITVSCSSSKKDKNQVEDHDFIETLTDEDFIPKRQVKYNSAGDYHMINDLVDDVLEDESLDKVSVEKLESFDESETGTVGLCYLGNTKEGLKKLDSIYDSNKSNPAYWNNFGICSLKAGKKKLAKLYFNKAVSLKSSYIPAINNLGVIYVSENKDAKAIAAFKQVLKIKRTSKTARFNLSNLYVKYGLYTKSNKALRSLYQINSQDKDVVKSLVYSYLFSGKSKEAYGVLSKLSRDDLDDPGLKIALYFSLKSLNSKQASVVLEDLNDMELQGRDDELFRAVKEL